MFKGKFFVSLDHNNPHRVSQLLNLFAEQGGLFTVSQQTLIHTPLVSIINRLGKEATLLYRTPILGNHEDVMNHVNWLAQAGVGIIVVPAYDSCTILSAQAGICNLGKKPLLFGDICFPIRNYGDLVSLNLQPKLGETGVEAWQKEIGALDQLDRRAIQKAKENHLDGIISDDYEYHLLTVAAEALPTIAMHPYRMRNPAGPLVLPPTPADMLGYGLAGVIVKFLPFMDDPLATLDKLNNSLK